MRLTKQNVEALLVPPGKQYLFEWDEALPGFGIKVNAGGSRQWVAQYRTADGRSQRLSIGRFPVLSADEARKQAKTILLKAQTGSDPQAERQADRAAAAVTFEVVADSYLRSAQTKLKPGSYDQIQRHLKKNWAPLANRPVNAIKRSDVAAHLIALSANGHGVNANRARSALSSMFAWAIGEGIADANPVAGTNKPKVEKSRDRVLSEDEVRAVWHACRDDGYGRIVRLLLLTGQRRDEVGSMTDAELDLGKSIWTIPGPRAKNGNTHEVPLSPLALEILAEQPRTYGRSLIFGQGVGGFSGWSNSKERLDRRIAANGLVMPHWTLHDLRRTAATMMAERLAVPPHVIEAVLNHVSGHRAGVAGIYNRASYRAEKRDALDRWAEEVRKIAQVTANENGA